MAVSAERYSRVAVVIHWLMAAAILSMLVMGFVMTGDTLPAPDKFRLFQLHKSIGITLLWLIALRLAWRLTHRPPEMNPAYPQWERLAASLGHLLLYILMIAMPLSGWLIVSSSRMGLPTLFFGWFEWPHVPGVTNENTGISDVSHGVHYYVAWGLVAMIAAHLGAVIKHWVVDRENILPRTWFGPRTAPAKLPEQLDA